MALIDQCEASKNGNRSDKHVVSGFLEIIELSLCVSLCEKEITSYFSMSFCAVSSRRKMENVWQLWEEALLVCVNWPQANDIFVFLKAIRCAIAWHCFDERYLPSNP